MEGTAITSNVNPLQRGVEQPSRDALKTATEEFEGMFLSYLLKVMRSTVDSEDDGDVSMGKDIYTEMFDNEIALSIARTRSLGIGEMMYRQLQESGQTSDRPSWTERGGASRDAAPGSVDPEKPFSGSTTPSARNKEASQFLLERAATPPVQEGRSLAVPVQGRMSSAFGLRSDPITGNAQFHKGIDIAAPEGTPFRAANGGTIVFAGVLKGYGNTVVIEHGNGSRTLYGHASQVLVRVGDVVSSGQPVGLIGKTGRATGAHLHFEALVGGQPLDPQALIATKDLDKVYRPIHR